MVDHFPSKVFYVQDDVHDFCSGEAKKEEFFKLINSVERFHALDFLHNRLTTHTENVQLHKRSDCSVIITIYVNTRHMRLVRVLQLGNTFLGDSLMKEIGSLLHLRFLKIQTEVKSIPLS
ncbi:hypothetical protein H5410_015315 [Solanum commersonii]|uniref:Uncharacterized protein n=1 Tax=Solanum commersonii TaxID=4109 RepID=A0A9J5ZTR6_SOLCO|nr:hypothetical protein H5410_015315 [Solanum commersonii]